MFCWICGKTVEAGNKVELADGSFTHRVCPSGAERSEVLQGCVPSATGSADARAADEAGADSSGRSADPRSGATEGLLACPFCGGEAVIEEIEQLGAIRKSAGCRTEGCQGYQSTITFSTYKEATKAWNTRAGDPKASAAPALTAQRERAGLPNAELSDSRSGCSLE